MLNATSQEPDLEAPSIEVSVDVDEEALCSPGHEDAKVAEPADLPALVIDSSMGYDVRLMDEDEDGPGPITRSWGIVAERPGAAVVPEVQTSSAGPTKTPTIRPASGLNQTLNGVGEQGHDSVGPRGHAASDVDLQDWLDLLPEADSRRRKPERYSLTCPVGSDCPPSGLMGLAASLDGPRDEAEVARSSSKTVETDAKARLRDDTQTSDGAACDESLNTHAWDLILQRAERDKAKESEPVGSDGPGGEVDKTPSIQRVHEALSCMTAWERAVARVKGTSDDSYAPAQVTSTQDAAVEASEPVLNRSAMQSCAAQSAEEQAALLFAEGYEALRTRDYDKAFELWQRSVSLDPMKRRYELNLRRLEQIMAERKDKGVEERRSSSSGERD